MKKVVFHINTLAQGGAERVVSTLANRLAEVFDVTIATLWVSENEYAIDKRVRRISVGLSEAQEKKGRLAKAYYRMHNLHAFLKEEKPDVVISFEKKANYRALIATMGKNIPVIVSVRTNPYLHYISLADRFLVPILFSRAKGAVFQTNGAKDFFPVNIQKKSKVILNPINAKYLNLPMPLERKKEVVQSGRIVGFKNQHMLINAFVAVHEKHPDYVLKLYGEDSGDGTWELLKKCINENNAEDYVFLMGGSNQLEKDIINAEVYAFSSDWEGLPNALMEAMAMGLPVVATDCPCGGPATLIQDEVNGLLVPIKNKEKMAAGINRLIEDREFAEKLGMKARAIVECADEEMICKQWENYILEVCK